LLERWGFTTITVADYLLFLEGHLHLPRRPMILTFDGIESFLPFFPALSEAGGRAMVFVGTDSLLGAEGERRIPLLRAMAGAGISIGSLTCSQQDLRTVSAGERREELIRSRVILHDLLGHVVESCAYPGDGVDGAVKLAVRDAGYAYAFTGPRGARLFGHDPFEVRRVDIAADAGPAALAVRAFSPGDRLVRLKMRSMAFIAREPVPTPSEPFA
jgi:peptidoglycan/xylan/chitin deacetylase (PgdA/CDA1 family)